MSIPPPPPPSTTTPQPKKQRKEKQYTKTVLFLASAFYPFTEWVGSKDIRRILLGGIEMVERMDLGDVKGYFHVEGFQNFGGNQSVELVAWRLHKMYGVDQIVCASEEELLRCASLRKLFGISNGQDYESTLRFRDKVIMKQTVKEAGLGVPQFTSIEGPIDLISFIDDVGYPVVVKPRKGYGSVNTKVIRNEQSLESYLSSGLLAGLDAPIDMMAESFVEGRFFHIDGFCYNGETKLVWPSEYVNIVVDFESNHFIAGYTLSESHPDLKRLQEFMIACNDALGGPQFFPFHGEAWITPDDEIIFCEVASRTGGGGIPYQILEAFAVSLSKSFVQYQADEPFTLESLEIPWQERSLVNGECIGWIYIYPKIGTVKQLPSNDCQPDYILFYLPYVEEGHIYTSRKSCADAVCCILVKGKTEEEVKSNIFSAESWFHSNCLYE